MSSFEAKLILGIENDTKVSKSVLNQAFVSHISINHPDRNGSNYIANKLIEAKEILSKEVIDK